MEKEFRTIVFIIPPSLSAAHDTSEMAAEFISKVDWLVMRAGPLKDIRLRILQSVRSSIRDGKGRVVVQILVFHDDCFVHVTPPGPNAKRIITPSREH